MKDSDLLEFENDINLLSFRTKGDLPIWFYMRFELFELLLEKAQIVKPVSHIRSYGLDTVKYLLQAEAFNRKHSSNTDGRIMFWADGQLLREDGHYYNRFADPLIDFYPNHTILYENAPVDWKWLMPRKNNNIRFYGPNLATCKTLARANRNKIYGVAELVEYVANRLRNDFGIELTEENKARVQRGTEICIQTYTREDEYLLGQCRRNGCKLLIMIGASLPYHYLLNKKAKEQGITIAELQHGIMSSGSYICNYGKALTQSADYTFLAPDYFLLWGKYWESQMGICKKAIIIGNAMRDKLIRTLKPEKKDLIVVVGHANDTEKFIRLTKKLQDDIKDYTVWFRPHPSERIDAQRINEKYGVILDMSADVYNVLNRTHVLVSDMSTLAFEAMGIVDFIFMWETLRNKEVFQPSPFAGFKDYEDLVDRINNSTEQKFDVGDIWEKSGKEQYLNFIEQFV